MSGYSGEGGSVTDPLRGITGHDDIVGDVVSNDRPGSNDHIFANAHAFGDDRARTHEGHRSDMDPAIQDRPRRHMAVVSDHTIVFYNRPGVENGILADDGLWIDQSAMDCQRAGT